MQHDFTNFIVAPSFERYNFFHLTRYSRLAMEFNKHLGKMHEKSIPELRELLERQEKLLATNSIVKKLPDKGEKARHVRDEIKKLLDKRHGELEVVINMMDKMSISSRNKEPVKDEDEEERRMLGILANNRTTGALRKEDLQFYSKLSDTIDLKPIHCKRERFNRLKTMNVKLAVGKSTPKFDEESAVVFPVGPHVESKLLSFGESLHLQPQYLTRVKEKKATLITKTDPNVTDEYHPDQIRDSAYREVPVIDSDLD